MHFPFCPGSILFLLVKMGTSLSLLGDRLQTEGPSSFLVLEKQALLLTPETFVRGEKGRAQSGLSNVQENLLGLWRDSAE